MNNGHNVPASETSLLTDFVEEVGEQFEVNQRSFEGRRLRAADGLMWVRAWHRYQLGQLSEVLGGCCEKELIARADSALLV